MKFQSQKTVLPLLVLACFVGMALGCGDDAPPVAPEPAVTAPQPAIPAPVAAAPAADDLGEELTAVEQQQLKAQFAAEAATEITTANAEAMAAQLEQEIDAELAAE